MFMNTQNYSIDLDFCVSLFKSLSAKAKTTTMASISFSKNVDPIDMFVDLSGCRLSSKKIRDWFSSGILKTQL